MNSGRPRHCLHARRPQSRKYTDKGSGRWGCAHRRCGYWEYVKCMHCMGACCNTEWGEFVGMVLQKYEKEKVLDDELQRLSGAAYQRNHLIILFPQTVGLQLCRLLLHWCRRERGEGRQPFLPLRQHMNNLAPLTGFFMPAHCVYITHQRFSFSSGFGFRRRPRTMAVTKSPKSQVTVTKS